MAENFILRLTGNQEVPPTGSAASGSGTVRWDATDQSATYEVTVTGLDFGPVLGRAAQTGSTDDDVTNMHVHNAARGTNGAVVFGQIAPAHDSDDLSIRLNGDGSWTISGVWEPTDPATASIAGFAAALNGASPGADVPLYFNVHTIEFPAGEIRGQWVAEEPTFGSIGLALNDFGRGAGGWVSADAYPRTLGDVNGDGRADVVGFGQAGTYVALGQADGSLAAAKLAIAEFGRGAGGWSSADTYPREVGDVNGDGRADVVGFGEAGTYVALGQADGSFAGFKLAIANFARGAGGWSSEDTYPREVGDVNGDGRADIVGFGEAGTYVALGQADGSFAGFKLAIAEFGRGAGGWVSADAFPRTLGDVNGDGRADVVGFGEAGTYVALGQADGSFAAAKLAIAEFGRGAGGWSSADAYPREVGDVNGDGRADIVGFGEAGAYVALGQADGSFAGFELAIANFGGGAGGWSSADTYPRDVGDVNGDGRADIVGFGEAGTYVALAQADGILA